MRYLPLPRQWAKRAFFAFRDHARVESPYVSLDSRLGRGTIVREGAVISHCRIGALSFVNSYALAYHTDIGPFCSIGPGAQLGPNEHLLENVTTCEALYPAAELARVDELNEARTTLAADVWVGSGAIVLKGCSLGVGSVVGAGALVREDVPPYAIVVGTPATVLRYRFDTRVIERLVSSAWWTLDDGLIRRALAASRPPEGGLSAEAFLGRLEVGDDG